MSFCARIILFIVTLIGLTGCDTFKNQSTEIHPDVINAQSNCYQWRNHQDFRKVHIYLDSVYASNNNIPKEQQVLKYLYLADMYTNQLHNMQMAKIYLDSAEKAGFSSPELTNAAIMFYFLKGFNALEDRKYEDAFQAYHYGKRVIDSIGDECRTEAFFQAVAYLNFRQEKYSDALNFYKLRRSIYHLCDTNIGFLNTQNELMTLNNIGLCFERMGNCDSALYYYNLGISLFNQKLEQNVVNQKLLTMVLGVLYGNKGGCLMKLGQMDSANSYLLKSIEINYHPDCDIKDAILTKIKLADLYLITSKIDACEQLISELRSDIEKYEYLTAEQRLTGLISRYHEKLSQFDQALSFLKKSQALKDSLRLHGQLLDSKYDFINEVESIRKEADINNLKHSGQRKSAFILIIFILLIAGVMVAISLVNKRKQDKIYVRKLENLNQTILQNNVKLQNSLGSLEQSQTENSRIMKILAHDLRSPVAGIINAIRVLKNNQIDPEEKQKILEMVEKSALNSLDFVDDLLSLNVNSNESQGAKIDLSLILDTCLQLHSLQAIEKNVSIHSNIQPVLVHVNQQRIWRVFNNIIVNAIKFTPPGKSIYIKSEENLNTVLVSIRDEGIGIPEPLKDKIFDMFSGVGRPGTGGERSFGLGLAISKQIVEAHHGRIWFKSIAGVGTEFFVELPLEKVNESD